MPTEKTRLDALLVQRGWYPDNAAATRAILAGLISSPERTDLKPGSLVKPDIDLIQKAEKPYVSRGGLKLAAALDGFAIDVGGARCLDVGAGSGGFTDCLLKRGAAAVTAIDVGYGQFDWRLRLDQRVTLLERTNFRTWQPGEGQAFDFIAADLSFIKSSGLLAQMRGLLAPDGQLVVLVKPQFELAGEQKEARDFDGVVRDPELHRQVLEGFLAAALQASLVPRGLMPSPLLGPQGNREFLFWATLKGRPATIDIQMIVRQASTL